MNDRYIYIQQADLPTIRLLDSWDMPFIDDPADCTYVQVDQGDGRETGAIFVRHERCGSVALSLIAMAQKHGELSADQRRDLLAALGVDT